MCPSKRMTTARLVHMLVHRVYRHVLFSLLDSPSNMVKVATGKRVAELVLSPDPIFTDFRNFPRLHHWMQVGRGAPLRGWGNIMH